MISQYLTATNALWGLLGTFIASVFTLLGLWIKYGPDNKRADNEAKVVEKDAAAIVLSEYAAQVKEFRNEVHKYKNEVQVLQGELMLNDKNMATMELVVELLITDAEIRDPNNPVVRQAKRMMARVTVGHQSKTTTHTDSTVVVTEGK